MEGMHDLADDADYADSQQQVKNNTPHVQSLAKKHEMKEVVKDSGSSSGPDASEVVYLKNNVAIHPTQYALERINGRLRLIKQGSSLFMTWIPCKQCSTADRLLNSRTSEKARNLYTIRAVPLAEVKSIRRHAPPLGWQYIIVVLTSGLAFPPLYFHNGGVREFLATLKEHVVLVRSADDANVFIVNDIHDPLQKSLTSLQLQGALPLANSRSSLNGQGVEHSMHLRKESLDDSQHNNHCNEPKETSAHRDRTRDPARDISIHVLERFSRVTKFARDTTAHLFGDNTAHLFGDNRLSGSMDGFKENSLVEVDSPSDATYATEPGQRDKLKGTESDTLLDAQHTDHRNGNLEVEEATNVGVFEIIDELQYQKMSLVWGKHRLPPLGYDEWSTFFDSERRVVDSKALRKRVFYGGIEHSMRQEVWKFLLGYYAFDSTHAEREYMSATKRAEYHTLKAQWQTITSSQAKKFSKFRERKSRIEKDVVRTDRSLPYYSGDDNPNVDRLRDILLTYSFYNFDLGYCQGMSDLLSPIMFVMEDESESFWCFTALMERLGPNFDRDQNGMHSQLLALSKLVELLDAPLHNYFKQTECLNYFFCFRWILIQFKREFEYEKVMRLWEVLWTRYLSEHFHLYMCVAVLKRFRKKIIEEEMDFDTLLKFINELSYHIDLESTLRDAEALCVCAGEAGLACIPPGTPPSLPNVQEAY